MNDATTEPGCGVTGSLPSLAGTEGTVVGRYRLVERIGEGGMGEVWRAEQTEPIRRQVAFKLIKGMNTREVIACFASERQTLALMDHPAIAKVFDAGSTPAGAPYFVMEIRRWSPDYRFLRPSPALYPPAPGIVHLCLRRSAARASEIGHPSRPETL